MNNYQFTVVQFDSIMVGMVDNDRQRALFDYGYGRSIRAAIAASHLDSNGEVLSSTDSASLKDWLKTQWHERVLISAEHKDLYEFSTLHELYVVDLNILPNGYEPDIYSSCQYVIDGFNDILDSSTDGRCTAMCVELTEQYKLEIQHASASYLP